MNSLNLLNTLEIKRALKTKLKQELKLNIFKTIDSTNNWIKELNDFSKLIICIAEEQTAGRGQFSRSWHSPFGQNIYLSIGFNIAKPINELSGFSLVAGLSVINTLIQYKIKKHLAIKWPNDIFYQGNKLAGILIETDIANSGCNMIVGIGLNVNMTEISKVKKVPSWISLKNILNTDVNRTDLVISLIENFVNYLNKFEEHGLKCFINQWKTFDYLFNKSITVKNGTRKMVGIAKGIDKEGLLKLKLNNNNLIRFASGEASIS